VGRRTWYAYAAFQVLGEICQWSWPSIHATIGPALWGGAFFLLLPGNLVGGFLIERIFWRTGLTLLQMQLLQVPLALGINLAVWALGAWAWRVASMKRRQAHQPGDLRL
jgi:hypothetical protein